MIKKKRPKEERERERARNKCNVRETKTNKSNYHFVDHPLFAILFIFMLSILHSRNFWIWVT